MRKNASLAWLLLLLVCGCDPGGLRRVQLRLPLPSAETRAVVVNSDGIQGALLLLNAEATRLGYQAVEASPGLLQEYILNRPPMTIEGQFYQAPPIHCRVRLINSGLMVTFGEIGLIGGQSESDKLYIAVRDAFRQRYGRKNVQSHRLGSG